MRNKQQQEDVAVTVAVVGTRMLQEKEVQPPVKLVSTNKTKSVKEEELRILLSLLYLSTRPSPALLNLSPHMEHSSTLEMVVKD
jgi:hypothetical protein